jgi:hypothetical protein
MQISQAIWLILKEHFFEKQTTDFVRELFLQEKSWREKNNEQVK